MSFVWFLCRYLGRKFCGHTCRRSKVCLKPLRLSGSISPRPRVSQGSFVKIRRDTATKRTVLISTCISITEYGNNNSKRRRERRLVWEETEMNCQRKWVIVCVMRFCTSASCSYILFMYFPFFQHTKGIFQTSKVMSSK